MRTTLKRFNGKYIVTVDEKRFTFNQSLKALAFVFDINAYGLKYTCEVYEKLNCMRQLHLIDSEDIYKTAVKQMLLDLRSGILMDNAIRGVILGDYTLEQLLARKGYAQ